MTDVLLAHGETAPPAEEVLLGAEGFEVRRRERAEDVLEESDRLLPESDSENGHSGNDAPGPDVLAASWFLPRLNGLGLTEELRKAGANLPILLLTRREDAEARAKALRHGADDCLTRPADPQVLTARLKALCRRPGEWTKVDPVRAGPLLVDMAKGEARANGRDLGLRRKELVLLYLLADRRPDVVSREMIATRVWGRGHVSDNSIDVTISGLRAELEAALEATLQDADSSGTSSLRPRVETVRGVGYRLALGPAGET